METGVNLVLLSDAEAKTYIKGSEMHKYAAYRLAHSYYEWIRLHNGVMPEGLDHMEMQLQKTKYYTFQAGQQRPSIREFIADQMCLKLHSVSVQLPRALPGCKDAQGIPG